MTGRGRSAMVSRRSARSFSCRPVSPPDAEAAAEAAARRAPSDHVDRTAIPFVTLDPASSTDLDQAFAIEQSGSDLILRYAIADIGWFVADGGPIDTEAWVRGETIYMPDGKISLYPPVLCEGAASLLPDGDRPAILFAVRVASDGCDRVSTVSSVRSSAAAPSSAMRRSGQRTCPPGSTNSRGGLRRLRMPAELRASIRRNSKSSSRRTAASLSNSGR